MGKCNILKQLFQEWKKARTTTIKEIRQLSVELQESETGYRIGQVAYSGAGIVSGGLAIAGILTAPLTGGLSLGLTTGSSAVGAVFGVAGLGHYGINYIQVRSRRQKAKQILDRDNELTKKLDVYIKVVINEMDDTGSAKPVASIAYQMYEIYDIYSNIRSVFETFGANNAKKAKKLDETAKILNIGKNTKKAIPGSIKNNMDAGMVQFAKTTSRVGKETAGKGKAATKFARIGSKLALPLAIMGTVTSARDLIDVVDQLKTGELSDS